MKSRIFLLILFLLLIASVSILTFYGASKLTAFGWLARIVVACSIYLFVAGMTIRKTKTGKRLIAVSLIQGLTVGFIWIFRASLT